MAVKKHKFHLIFTVMKCRKHIYIVEVLDIVKFIEKCCNIANY